MKRILLFTVMAVATMAATAQEITVSAESYNLKDIEQFRALNKDAIITSNDSDSEEIDEKTRTKINFLLERNYELALDLYSIPLAEREVIVNYYYSVQTAKENLINLYWKKKERSLKIITEAIGELEDKVRKLETVYVEIPMRTRGTGVYYVNYIRNMRTGDYCYLKINTEDSLLRCKKVEDFDPNVFSNEGTETPFWEFTETKEFTYDRYIQEEENEYKIRCNHYGFYEFLGYVGTDENDFLYCEENNYKKTYTISVDRENAGLKIGENGKYWKQMPDGTVKAMPEGDCWRVEYHGGIMESIDEVTIDQERPKGIYNLKGERLKEVNSPGIYIINGEKILKK